MLRAELLLLLKVSYNAFVEGRSVVHNRKDESPLHDRNK